MSASEIVVITNSSESDDWFEIADAGHNVVQFNNQGGRASQIAVGEEVPTIGIPLTAGYFHVRVEHANTKVWARIIHGSSGSITVMRGDALFSEVA